MGCRMFQQNLTSVVVDKTQKGSAKGITSLTEYGASFFEQLISFSAAGFQNYCQSTIFQFQNQKFQNFKNFQHKPMQFSGREFE